MNHEDAKLWRAARRKVAMANAADRATWSGGRLAMANRKREAARRACRGKVTHEDL